MAEYIPAEVSISDLRAKIADVVNSTTVDGEVTYLTSRGRRVAALVPVRLADEEVRRRNKPKGD